MIDNRIDKVLLTADEIEAGINKCAQYINKKFKQSKIPPLMVGVLKGCIPFLGRLISKVEFDMELDFIAVASYHGTESTQNVKIVTDLATDVKNRDVILIEDIVDTAFTIHQILEIFKNRQAKSITFVTLLDKPSRRILNLKPDYFCFTIPNYFVVGFGLDYNQKFRNLPYIGVLKKSYYS